MNRIRITQTIRACVIVPPALCFAFQQTTDGTPAAGQTAPEAADLILHHGFVWTVDESKPQAEAVAARGDRIIKVGGNEEVLALRGEHTRLIDLKGASVKPAFNDSHVHFAGEASFFWNLLREAWRSARRARRFEGEDPLYDRRWAGRLPALSTTTKISTKLSLNRIKVIDSAASLRYMCACLDSKGCGYVFTYCRDVVVAVPPYNSKSLH